MNSCLSQPSNSNKRGFSTSPPQLNSEEGLKATTARTDSSFQVYVAVPHPTAMHSSSFLLGIFALLTSTAAAAPLVKRGPPSIIFCDHPGAEQWGRCVVETIEDGVCKPIPNSNDMGDSGSTWAVSHNAHHIQPFSSSSILARSNSGHYTVHRRIRHNGLSLLQERQRLQRLVCQGHRPRGKVGPVPVPSHGCHDPLPQLQMPRLGV